MGPTNTATALQNTGINKLDLLHGGLCKRLENYYIHIPVLCKNITFHEPGN